jgi:hypothetical protein
MPILLYRYKILENGKNRLGRIYDSLHNIFPPNVKVYGYLNDRVDVSTKIDLTRISHICTNFVIDESDNVYCDITVLDTPMGIISQELLRTKANITTNISGLGVLYNNVISEFILTSIDFGPV